MTFVLCTAAARQQLYAAVFMSMTPTVSTESHASFLFVSCQQGTI